MHKPKLWLPLGHQCFRAAWQRASNAPRLARDADSARGRSGGPSRLVRQLGGLEELLAVGAIGVQMWPASIALAARVELFPAALERARRGSEVAILCLQAKIGLRAWTKRVGRLHAVLQARAAARSYSTLVETTKKAIE